MIQVGRWAVWGLVVLAEILAENDGSCPVDSALSAPICANNRNDFPMICHRVTPHLKKRYLSSDFDQFCVGRSRL